MNFSRRTSRTENRIRRIENSAGLEGTICLNVPEGGIFASMNVYAAKADQALKISYWIDSGTLTVSANDITYTPEASAATVLMPLKKGDNTVVFASGVSSERGQIIIEKSDIKE